MYLYSEGFSCPFHLRALALGPKKNEELRISEFMNSHLRQKTSLAAAHQSKSESYSFTLRHEALTIIFSSDIGNMNDILTQSEDANSIMHDTIQVPSREIRSCAMSQPGKQRFCANIPTKMGKTADEERGISADGRGIIPFGYAGTKRLTHDSYSSCLQNY